MQSKNSDQARQCFSDAGLTYSDVTSGDICTLVMILNRNIKKACKNKEMSTDSMRMSEKIDIKCKSNGSINTCYLYINSHYFTRRECISFNSNGFIGFCGWADDSNSKVITDSFIEWVGEIKPEVSK